MIQAARIQGLHMQHHRRLVGITRRIHHSTGRQHAGTEANNGRRVQTGWSSYPPNFLTSVKRPSDGVPLPPPGRPKLKFSFRNGFFYAGMAVFMLSVMLIRRGYNMQKKKKRSQEAYKKSLEKKIRACAFDNLNHAAVSIACGKPATSLQGLMEPQNLFRWIRTAYDSARESKKQAASASSDTTTTSGSPALYTLKIKLSSLRNPVNQAFQLMKKSVAEQERVHAIFIHPSLFERIRRRTNDPAVTIPKPDVRASESGNNHQNTNYDIVLMSDSKETIEKFQNCLGYWACERKQLDMSLVEWNESFNKMMLDDQTRHQNYSLPVLHPAGCSFATLVLSQEGQSLLEGKQAWIKVIEQNKSPESLLISNTRIASATKQHEAEWYFSPSKGQIKAILKEV